MPSPTHNDLKADATTVLKVFVGLEGGVSLSGYPEALRLARHYLSHPHIVTGKEGEGRLVEALKDAIEGMEDMICYVDKYFRDKWGHDDYIARAKAALPKPEASTGEANG